MVLTAKNNIIGMNSECDQRESEIKSGRLHMVQTFNNKVLTVPVFLRVYKTRFEHYAIVHKDQLFTNSGLYLSLKNCQISKGESNEIKIVPNSIDGGKVTFVANSKSDGEEWMTSLQSSRHSRKPEKPGVRFHRQNIPKTLLMPSVEEEEE
ncbi:Hypothetical predicted protein [Mytilus galloprovincialis]|uniref:PH domain-containing protein n=1 Tax=Mytilus galloprovincialis TaxID=29158 RepID=A0A8B6CCJ3_MYTGA|nr:Hypothetical predicted protein [Mytilus galloprovincialis]